LPCLRIFSAAEVTVSSYPSDPLVDYSAPDRLRATTGRNSGMLRRACSSWTLSGRRTRCRSRCSVTARSDLRLRVAECGQDCRVQMEEVEQLGDAWPADSVLFGALASASAVFELRLHDLGKPKQSHD